MMSGYILTEAVLAEMREWAKKTGVTEEIISGLLELQPAERR